MSKHRVRHILSLSGGKDSTALAVYLRDRIPDLEYVFCDTEKELPETYEYLARVEAYPDLKASANFQELQAELVNTEDRIQAARRFYNGNVRDFNNRVETFPSNVIANAFGFRPLEFFEVKHVRIRVVPNVLL